MGTKKSVLVEGEGGPLAVVIEAANINDHQLLRQTIEAIVVERPKPSEAGPQHLCLDAGYDNQSTRKMVTDTNYVPHIRPVRPPEKPPKPSKKSKPRRWVVERTLAWLSKCRGILVRYDKKDENYLGLLQLACALLWYRRLHKLKHSNTNQAKPKPS